MIKASQLKNHTLSDIAKALSKILSDEHQRKVLRELEWIRIKKDEERAQNALDEMESKSERYGAFLNAMKEKYGHEWIVKASIAELEEADKREKEYMKSRERWLKL